MRWPFLPTPWGDDNSDRYKYVIRLLFSTFRRNPESGSPKPVFEEPWMETLTRLVTDSLARHGFDRPMDPRRLQWSRWFRCDSPHSLLVVPSKPGIFAIAEEIMEFGNPHVGTAAPGCPAEQGSAAASSATTFEESTSGLNKRLLAVLQFSEDDDMAFTLDRMFTRINPMRARLASGKCFLRFVVIEDQDQRRGICSALNQWMLSSAEKASGIPAGFSSSLELAPVTDRVDRTLMSDSASGIPKADHAAQAVPRPDSQQPPPCLDSGANKNLHCPHPLPSGF